MYIYIYILCIYIYYVYIYILCIYIYRATVTLCTSVFASSFSKRTSHVGPHPRHQMEPLVEVVTAQELELALAVKARVIGVNNRPSTAKILLDVHGILLR